MSQTNYFTYNIIDALYYNQPTGDDLVKMYGVNSSFNRRNNVVYNNMTDEEKENFDNNEKKFIQAVINRYIFDDVTNKTYGTYVGIYDPNDPEHVNNTENTVTYTYFKPNRKIGIELSDMVSNVNGTHDYKLMSAKDIDFDNIILPNSAISNTFNWGSFDINRRWGDKPIRINNTFELLNVIDYLLCACDNLWNELYKIKYSTNVGVQIWFTKDVEDIILINNVKKLVTQDFQIEESQSSETRMITYLDPFNYYTSLTNNPNHRFGLVTNFYKTDQDGELSFDRKVIDIRYQNIVLMVILPSNKIIEDYASTTNQNINGQLQAIYAYKIGDELKLYPGARIDTFTDENNIVLDSNALVDFTNKKLKDEVFFKTDTTTNAKYNLVYIKFLDVKQLGLDDIKNPYFLYYINNDNKKVILSCNYEDSNVYSSNVIKTQLQLKLFGFETYKFAELTSNALSNDMIYVDPDTNITYPKYYVMCSKFHTSLEVATPNSSNFSSGSQSITIYWYKNRNKLNCKITRLDKSNNEIEIKSEEDLTQKQSLSYHSFRYNVPDGENITFKFDATYIALNNENPLGLKLDDEYDDIMLYNFNNISSADVSKYYKYSTVDTTAPFQRHFEQFTEETFENNKHNYISTDSTNTQYKHTWVKNENPYRLTMTIDNDEFNNQLQNKEDVLSEIALIKNGNKFTQTSYNTYVFNHELTDGIEQIKLDLKFKIEETSKVKAVEYTVPLNINKIYYPTINYYSKDAIELERNIYSSIIYPTSDRTSSIALSNIHDTIYNKYGASTGINTGKLETIPDIYNIMTGEHIQNLETDLLLPKTYDCTVNNSIFEITYSQTNNIVNILGSWYTEKYVENSPFSTHKFANMSLKVNGIGNVLKDNSTSVNKHPYIFNMNGFGRNYRMHGNGQYVSDVWANYPISTNQAKEFYNQFDLISVATLNEVVSINKQLKIKLTDGDENETNYQLQNICLEIDNDDNGIWNSNNMDFNSGMNIKTQSEMDNMNNEDAIYNDYSIRTLTFEIYKGTYITYCPTIFDQIVQNNDTAITYYVPVTYMYINSSTFFPPLSTKPQGNVHDLNDNDDLIRYNNYITCWNDENNYHPVTLSMKLFDNTTITNPYYYESNEAKMKFNIKRIYLEDNSTTVQGTNNIIYVALGARYYLSDFLRVGSINENSVINNENNLINADKIPSGSYFYYNDNYKMHVVAEIPANFAHNAFSNEHNAHYKYYEGDKTKLTNPDFTTDVTSENIKKIVPYPVFNKQIINLDESLSYSPTTYNYDIYRVADINKINFNVSNAFAAEVITIKNEADNNITNLNNNDAVGMYTNASLYCIDFGVDFINNFADLKASNSSTFNMILYHLYYSSLFGSKNYQGGGTTTGSTNTKIAPIIRQKRTEEQFSTLNMYYTVHYSGGDPQYHDNSQDYLNRNGDYEFFEFKYEDIVEIKNEKQNPNDPDFWTVKSLAPGTTTIEGVEQTLSAEEAYDLQLQLFLLNSDTDFIANMAFWTNYYSSEENSSTIEPGE